MVRMGKIVISVIATTGYNDEILSSPDRRYKRFLLYSKPEIGNKNPVCQYLNAYSRSTF